MNWLIVVVLSLLSAFSGLRSGGAGQSPAKSSKVSPAAVTCTAQPVKNPPPSGSPNSESTPPPQIKPPSVPPLCA